MAESEKKFAQLLTKGILSIRALEPGKSIHIIQDELGYALGRESGGSAIEYWRKEHIPSIQSDVEKLAREIVRRSELGREWLEQFLNSAGYPDPLSLCDELFPLPPPSSTSDKPYQELVGQDTFVSDVRDARASYFLPEEGKLQPEAESEAPPLEPEPEPEPEAPQPTSLAQQAVRNLVILFVIAVVSVLVIVVLLRDSIQEVTITPTAQAVVQQQPTITNTPAPTPISITPVVSPQPSPTVVAAPSATDSEPTSESVCGEAIQVEDTNGGELVKSQGVIIYTEGNTPGGVLGNCIRALTTDTNGIWVGYCNGNAGKLGGVSYYNRGDKKFWANCNQSGVTGGAHVNAIETDQTGKVWVTTDSNGVLVYDGTSWRTFTEDNSELPDDRVYGLTIDEDNNVWVGTYEGVAKYNGDSWTTPYRASDNTVYDDRVHAIAFDSSHNVWVGHLEDGVSQLRSSDGRWVHHTMETSGLGGNHIRDIAVRQVDADSVESVWFATADGGVSRFEQGEWTVYRVDDGLPSNDVQAVALDKHNRVWVATMGGVAYFDDQEWTIYNTVSTYSITFGPSCQNCPLDDDQVWTGTNHLGLTYSRLPYPNDAIDIVEVCFVLVERERERVCPPLAEVEGAKIITITYPGTVAPNEKFRFEVDVSPRAPYQLREDRGDLLSNLDANGGDLFGAWLLIPVEGTIEPGQPFTFTDISNPLVAPQLADGEREKTFTSRWRVWMHARYAGPAIHINFTVERQ